jgi:hypothetical protein
VYLIGVELQSNSSEQLAFAIPMTGGRYYNVRRTIDLEQAFAALPGERIEIPSRLMAHRNR